MKIYQRLLLMPLLTMVLLAILSAVSFWGLRGQQLATNDIYKVRFQFYRESEAMAKLMYNLNGRAYQILNSINAGADRDELQKSIDGNEQLFIQIQEKIVKLKTFVGGSAEPSPKEDPAAGNNTSPQGTKGISTQLADLLVRIESYKKGMLNAIQVVRDGDVDIGAMLMLGAESEFKEITTILESISGSAEKLSDQAFQRGAEDYKSTLSLFWIVVAASILISLELSFIITRSITRPIINIAEGLSEASAVLLDQVEQVEGMGHELSQSSDEQADSIESTAEAITEMSTMTKSNAVNVQQANALSENTSQTVALANDSMREVITSMEQVHGDSQKTSAIIKSIDDIAFQTNLLALNAAVEAARAGEAGRGFAVVAEEVRSLAMRTAKAAKETEDLIERTLGGIKNGVALVGKTNEAFSEVSSSTGKVVEIIRGIGTGSKEQAVGIEQISNTVAIINAVTHKTATGARLSLEASERMGELAEQIQGLINSLTSLVKD